MNIAHSCAEVPALGAGAQSEARRDEDSGSINIRSIPKVLLVDDELHVLTGIKRALSDYSYRINIATSAEVALQMCRCEQFDVIVADERMPRMRGTELLTIVGREFPTTGRIMLTGHATVDAAARAINEAGVIRFLLKPCPPSALRAAIELALRTTPFEHRTRAARNPPAALRRRTHAAIRGRRAGGAATTWHELQNAGAADQIANEASGLFLRAQRVLVLEGGQLAGLEVSARLGTQTRELRTAYGVIASADHHLIQDALRVLGRHRRQIDRSQLTMSLTIGCQSLADPGFAHFLENAFSESRLAPRLMIGIRASSLVQRLRTDPGFREGLGSMKCLARGTRLCVDGVTGELAQLALLTDLPISLVKIDSRNIGDVLVNPDSEARVRDIVAWGMRIGVEVAAAGVDTFAISERLHTLGVRYGQGGAFGTPQPLESLLGRPCG